MRTDVYPGFMKKHIFKLSNSKIYAMVDDKYYWKNLRELSRMKNKHNSSRASWFRHLALVASSVLAILVALNKGNNCAGNIFQVFAYISLILCILSSLTASWFEVYLLNRSANDFHTELQHSFQKGIKAEPVYGNKPLPFRVAEFVAIISFVSSCILLSL